MNKEYLNVILADDSFENQTAFRNIFEELKISIKFQTFDTEKKLMEYLTGEGNPIPEILFMNHKISGKSSTPCLEKIRTFRFCNMVIAVYAEHLSDNDTEEIFIKGGNICMTHRNEYNALKKNLSEVITTNWQYHTSGLNKDNFIMKV